MSCSRYSLSTACNPWGNFDWNLQFFPDPVAFSNYVHNSSNVVGRPLALALNVREFVLHSSDLPLSTHIDDSVLFSDLALSLVVHRFTRRLALTIVTIATLP
jgi:hypothetical protein